LVERLVLAVCPILIALDVVWINASFEAWINKDSSGEHKTVDSNTKKQDLHDQNNPVIICSRGKGAGQDDPNEGYKCECRLEDCQRNSSHTLDFGRAYTYHDDVLLETTVFDDHEDT
jgi:hypothetical protein